MGAGWGVGVGDDGAAGSPQQPVPGILLQRLEVLEGGGVQRRIDSGGNLPPL